VPDSLSYSVAAMVVEWGGEVVLRDRLPDDPSRILYAVDLALAQADLIVVTGGASVGEKDFAQAALDAADMTRIFSKVRMKPGKPVWFGRAGECLVLGLPGNPVSAMVTARLFMAPLLAGLSGGAPDDALSWLDWPLVAGLPACGDRETFTRARRTEAGAEPLEQQESGAYRSLANADLLLRQYPHEPARSKGAWVNALDL
jgi:molybdopterin molybdotransferase